MVPPGPVQVRLNVPFAVSAPVDVEPEAARLPLQAPLALQVSALAVDQVSVVASPESMDVSAVLNDRVGASG